jgi:hypothetical protein
MSADEFSVWQQNTDKFVAVASPYEKRAYRLAMTALVVAISALAVSTIVLLASLSTSSPEPAPPARVTRHRRPAHLMLPSR